MGCYFTYIFYRFSLLEMGKIMEIFEGKFIHVICIKEEDTNVYVEENSSGMVFKLMNHVLT